MTFTSHRSVLVSSSAMRAEDSVSWFEFASARSSNPGMKPPTEMAPKKKSRPSGKSAPALSVHSRQLSPTEQRNPRSANLDRLSVGAAIELMLTEEARVTRVLLAKRAGLGRAVTLAARAFRRGGRLFYVGAGTSGRFGVLDATECPPMFRVPPTMVQGIIADEDDSVWDSVVFIKAKRPLPCEAPCE